jgi:hypothetical protein
MAWTKLTTRNAWLPALVLGLVAAGLAAAGWNTHFWEARRSSLESNPHGSCRAYAEAQNMFKRHDWDKDGKFTYACPFTLLYTTLDENGQPIQLIDGALAQATSPNSTKHGYYFGEPKTIDDWPIDWEKDFALCATPAVYGRTGFSTFVITTDGRVWGKDLGRSELVDDFPADPRQAGWYDADNEAPPGRTVTAFWKPFLPAVLAGLAVGGLAWLAIILVARRRSAKPEER